MKLIYRANTYDYDPTLLHRTPQRAPEPWPVYHLIYRGATYLVDPEAINLEKPVRPATYELICRGTVYQVSQTLAGQRSIEVKSSDRRSHLSPRLKLKQMFGI